MYIKILLVNCLLIVLFVTNNFAQSAMSLWYIPDIPFSQRGQHHHPNSVEIPCDWNYYHRADGQDKIIEYGIRNEGNAPLILTLPLAFENSSAIHFQIIEQPEKATLEPGEDIHFKVKYIDMEKVGALTAELPILSNDAHRPNCTIRFRVGGFSLDPLPDEVNCFAKYEKISDYGAEPTPRDIQTITRTLDEHNNVLEERDVLTNESGDILAEFTATSTYNSQNQPLTYKEVYLSGYKGFTCDELITSTYDENNNLIKEVIITTTTAGGYNITHNYTYTSNNLVVQDLVTYTNPFVSNGSSTINYVYDANGNLLTKTENDSGGYTSTKTNTYDSNNNLLTCEKIENGFLTFSISNTYDADNMLVSSSETDGVGNAMSTFTYDANNKLITTEIERTLDPFGFFIITETITYTYNSFHSLVKQVSLSEVLHLNRSVERTRMLTYDSNNSLIGITSEVLVGNSPTSAFTEQITITPCAILQPKIQDPCSCSNSLNKVKDDNVTHFHDVLSVSGLSGAAVVLQVGNTNFLDNNLTQIADGTNLGTIPASGVLEYDFFHESGASGAITLTVGGVLTNPFNISVCDAQSCIIIPTMSQWGLLIFGLLILNLGILFIYRMNRLLKPSSL